MEIYDPTAPPRPAAGVSNDASQLRAPKPEADAPSDPAAPVVEPAADAAQDDAPTATATLPGDNNPPTHGIEWTDEEVVASATTDPFPLGALPAAIGGIVSAVAVAERVPHSLPAAIAIGILSASIGRRLKVQVRDDRFARGNLYLLVTAAASSGKSECIRTIDAPLRERQGNLTEKWRKTTLPDAAAELRRLESRLKLLANASAKTTDKDEAASINAEMQYCERRKRDLATLCQPPLLVVDDVTSECLSGILQDNDEVIFSVSADARKLCDVLIGRYSAGELTDDALYVKCWTGDAVQEDRKGRGHTSLRNPCMSLLWLIQPDALQLLLEEDSLSQGGFLPRCLIIQTRAQMQKIEGVPAGVAAGARARWATLIFALMDAYHPKFAPSAPTAAGSAIPDPCHIIQPTPEALAKFTDYHNEIVDQVRADLNDVMAFAGRWCEQAWRLAVVLHAALHGAAAHQKQLELETAENAILLAKWFARQQLDLIAGGRYEAHQKLVEKVLALIDREKQQTGGKKDYITHNTVHHARYAPTAEAAKALLARMEKEGVLISIEHKPAAGGRTSRRYRRVSNSVPG